MSRVVAAIARVSASELIRDRVLYNVLVVAILLMAAGFGSSRLSFLSPGRVVLDFGMTGVQLSGFILAALLGANLIPRERERRTLLVVLARPISYAEFILGKFLGLASVLTVNWMLISAFTFSLVYLGSDERSWQALHPTFEWALFLSLIQSLIVAALAIFLSVFSTVSLSVMISMGLYVLGSNAQYLRVLAEQSESGVTAFALRLGSHIVPNYDLFNLGLKVTYGLPIATRALAASLVYGAATLFVLLGLSALLLQRTESTS